MRWLSIILTGVLCLPSALTADPVDFAAIEKRIEAAEDAFAIMQSFKDLPGIEDMLEAVNSAEDVEQFKKNLMACGQCTRAATKRLATMPRPDAAAMAKFAKAKEKDPTQKAAKAEQERKSKERLASLPDDVKASVKNVLLGFQAEYGKDMQFITSYVDPESDPFMSVDTAAGTWMGNSPILTTINPDGTGKHAGLMDLTLLVGGRGSGVMALEGFKPVRTLYRWKAAGDDLSLTQMNSSGPCGEPEFLVRASLKPKGWIPAGTWKLTHLALRSADDKSGAMSGGARVIISASGSFSIPGGRELFRLLPDGTAKMEGDAWNPPVEAWEGADGRVAVFSENRKLLGMLLMKEPPDSKPLEKKAAPAPWAGKPTGQWPLIALRQKIDFGNASISSGTAFLFRTKEGGVAASTARLPFTTLDWFRKTPSGTHSSPQRQVFRVFDGYADEHLDYDYPALSDRVKSWQLVSASLAAPLDVTRVMRDSLPGYNGLWHQLPLSLKTAPPNGLEVLQTRKTRPDYGEKIYVAVPTASGQRIVSGSISLTSLLAYSRGIQFDQPEPESVLAGAPVIDVDGRVVGFVTGASDFALDPEKAVCFSVEELKDTLAKDKE